MAINVAGDRNSKIREAPTAIPLQYAQHGRDLVGASPFASFRKLSPGASIQDG